MGRRIIIFDTTLRDGEQSPGASLTPEQKVTIAHQLAALGVDVIEAGFPISSPADFEAVSAVAWEVKGPVICGLARALEEDIRRCWEAVRQAERPRIHTFIGTSDVHVEKKLRKTKEEVLEMAVEAVRLARSLCDDVEFSPEDALRTDFDYLCRVVEATIAAGATTVNIPDTVGYSVPWEMEETIRRLMERVPNIGDAVISVHCHNDLGLATANSLAAVRAGASQIECTINGIGERAGMPALEEIVMTLHVRRDLYDVETGINTEEIIKTSRMVSSFTGMPVQPNKAIVGVNAFAHESGIHQHGYIMDRQTYEIMRPEDVGLRESILTLGRRSGRHGLRQRLSELGYEVSDAQMDDIYQRFIEVADRKKQVYDEDLHVLMREALGHEPQMWRIKRMQVTSGTVSEEDGSYASIPTAAVELERQGEVYGPVAETGNGPIDAVYRAIEKAVGLELSLVDYQIRSISVGTDALGEATVRVADGKAEAWGKAASTDVIEASARAYVNAINRLMVLRQRAENSGKNEKSN
jgi:2-isopropylmalate synthase